MKIVLILAATLSFAYTKCPAFDLTEFVERAHNEEWFHKSFPYRCTITNGGGYSVQPISTTSTKTGEHKCPTTSANTLNKERSHNEEWEVNGWIYRCSITESNGSWSVDPIKAANAGTTSTETGSSEHKCAANAYTLNQERSHNEEWVKDGWIYRCTITNSNGAYSIDPIKAVNSGGTSTEPDTLTKPDTSTKPETSTKPDTSTKTDTEHKCPASDYTLNQERAHNEEWIRSGWIYRCTITSTLGAWSVDPIKAAKQ